MAWLPGEACQVYLISSEGGGLQKVTKGENHGDPQWLTMVVGWPLMDQPTTHRKTET
jgi:hypothetical protein